MELKLDKLVKIEKKENSKMRGIAKVLIDGCFLVEDIRILEGDDGLFIAMPSKTLPDGSIETRHILLIRKLESYLKI